MSKPDLIAMAPTEECREEVRRILSCNDTVVLLEGFKKLLKGCGLLSVKDERKLDAQIVSERAKQN